MTGISSLIFLTCQGEIETPSDTWNCIYTQSESSVKSNLRLSFVSNVYEDRKSVQEDKRRCWLCRKLLRSLFPAFSCCFVTERSKCLPRCRGDDLSSSHREGAKTAKLTGVRTTKDRLRYVKSRVGQETSWSIPQLYHPITTAQTPNDVTIFCETGGSRDTSAIFIYVDSWHKLHCFK